MKPLLKNWLFRNNKIVFNFFNTALANFGKSCIVLLLIFLPFKVFAQNMVPNSSFEIYTTCPSASSQISYAIPWIGTNASTDYFNSCAPSYSFGVPWQSTVSYQLARTGNSFAGIWGINGFTNYREYLQVQLLDTLINGSCYKVSFFVNLHNYMIWGINNLAAHISNSSFTTSGSPVFLTPHIYKFGNPEIIDTLGWVEITGIYYPSGGEKYITIGNYKDDSNTDTLLINPSGGAVGYYYIDDVSVIPIDSIPGGIPANAGNDTTILGGDSVFIGQEITNLNCNWYIGTTLIADSISGIFVSPTATTTYTVEQNLCGTITYDTVTIFVSGVGINEREWSSEINLYPNPNAGEFNINFKGLENSNVLFEIIDISGSLVCSKNLQLSNGMTNFKLDISNGVYFVHITNTQNHETIVKKLVIQK